MKGLPPLGPNPLILTLRHAQLRADQERQLARIVVEEGGVLPEKPGTMKLPGDPFAARGVPITGFHGGVGGAIRGSKPGDGLE